MSARDMGIMIGWNSMANRWLALAANETARAAALRTSRGRGQPAHLNMEECMYLWRQYESPLLALTMGLYLAFVSAIKMGLLQ